jgi:hypothetical protein
MPKLIKNKQNGFLINPFRMAPPPPPAGLWLAYKGNYLISAMAYAGNATGAGYDSTAITDPNWAANFGATTAVGVFAYNRSAGVADTGTIGPKIIDSYDPNAIFDVVAWNHCYYVDLPESTIEFLDANNVVQAVFSTIYKSDFCAAIKYGPDIAGLAIAPYYQNGAVLYCQGRLTLSPSGFSWVPDTVPNNSNTLAFTYNKDLSTVTKLRVTIRAKSNYTGGCPTYCSYRIV